MTESELTNWLRENIILDGPDSWRTNGYLQEAERAGLPLADALKRAADINQEIINNTLLLQSIQDRIVRMSQASRSHLIEQDLRQIINAAASLKLSSDFVKSRWIPNVLQISANTLDSKLADISSIPTLPTETPPINRLAVSDESIKQETIINNSTIIEPAIPIATPIQVEDQYSSLAPSKHPPIKKSFTVTCVHPNTNLIIRILISAVAVYVASLFIPGISVTGGAGTYLIVAIVLGFLNAFIKPILTILTIPITLVTLGLFLLVLNVLMVYLTSYLVPNFHVTGFIAALLFSIVVSIVTSLIDAIV